MSARSNLVRARPVAGRVRAATAVSIAVLLLGALATTFNMSVTNVALPTLAAKLDAGGLQIHLIGDGFTIALTALVLLLGAAGDRYGRKRFFLAGAALMVPASLLASWSRSANELIVWRTVSGVAVAMLFPTTLSMISSLAADAGQRARYVALWSATAAAGTAIAPVVAGMLLERFWWGSVFLVSVPFALAALLAGARFLRDNRPSLTYSIDWPGGVLSALAIVALLFPILLVPVDGFSTRVLVLLAIAVLAHVAFVLRERRAAHPLLPLSVFSDRRFAIAGLTMVLMMFAMLGVMYLASQYLQNVLGYSTLRSGLAGLPLTVAVLLASAPGAALDGRWGSKLVIAGGLLIVAAGFGTGLLWSATSPYALIALSYVLIGGGLGLALTPVSNAILGALPPEQAGVGSAVNDVTRDFGSALGIAVSGSLASLTYAADLRGVFAALPAAQQGEISDNVARTISGSLAGALAVAQRYPDQQQPLVQAAREAFLRGQSAAMTLSAALCIASAVLVLLLLPARATAVEPQNPPQRTQRE